MGFFIPNSPQIQTNSQSLLIHSYPSLACYLFNKLFNSIARLLYFINLQLVIPGRTWILLYLGRTMYKRLWVCLALYSAQLYFILGRAELHWNFSSIPKDGSDIHRFSNRKPVSTMCTVGNL